MKIIDAAAHFEHAVKKSNEFHGFRYYIKRCIVKPTDKAAGNLASYLFTSAGRT